MNSDESFFQYLHAVDLEIETEDDPTYIIVEKFWKDSKVSKTLEKVKCRKLKTRLSHKLGSTRESAATSEEGIGSLRRVVSHLETENMQQFEPPPLRPSS